MRPSCSTHLSRKGLMPVERTHSGWKRVVFPNLKYLGTEAEGQFPSGKEIYRTAYALAWPATVEAVFVGLVSFIDTMMVSSLGKTAVAAVGLTNQPKFLALSFILALNVGVTAVVARRLGEERREEATRCLRQSLVLSALVSLVICSLSFIFARPYILAAGAKSDTIDLAVGYFRIIIVGQFFQNISLTINSALRCAGVSKISMQTNVTANLVNVVFNYLLINGHFGFPALGVNGAAIATALGCLVAFGMSTRSLLGRKSPFHIRLRDSWRLQAEMVGSLWNVAGSALFENICMRIGFFVYALIVANLGTTQFAIHQICMNLTNMTFSCFDGFSVAAAALVGRSLGAKKPELAQVYGQVCYRMAFVLATTIVVIYLVFKAQLLGLFSLTGGDLAIGMNIIVIVACSAHAQAATLIFAGALRGAGDTKFVALFSMISTMIIRPILSWILCYPVGLGLYGPWLCLSLDFYLRCVLNYGRFRLGSWKNRVV
jgi:putative MATE family efflux protein